MVGKHPAAGLLAALAAFGGLLLPRLRRRAAGDELKTSDDDDGVPILIYGKRRVKPGMVEQFKDAYSAHARALYEASPDVKAVVAFADKADPCAYWHVVWVKRAAAFADVLERVGRSPASAALSSCYASLPDDPDTLDVYGGWCHDAVPADTPSVRYHFHRQLAGFLKADGAGLKGPPCLGVRRSHVKPGKVGDLAQAFRTVCDIWRATAPGILAASVSRDHTDPNMVHDLRLFANYDAYLSHVDKTNAALTAAMGVWFTNYDMSVPFTGELFAADPNKKAMHTASIKSNDARDAKGPQIAMASFTWGEAMLGPMPNMTKNE